MEFAFPLLSLCWHSQHSNLVMDTELEEEPAFLCQGEYLGSDRTPRLCWFLVLPMAQPGQRWQRWNVTQYLRRSQNMSMISRSDWTHKSREKSSN